MEKTYTKYNADGIPYIIIEDDDVDPRIVDEKYCYVITGEAIEKFAMLERGQNKY